MPSNSNEWTDALRKDLRLLRNRKSSKPKPTRRRPTDSERLTWLLRGGCTKEYTYDYSKYAYEIRYRQQIDRLMREEAKRG